ncbi:MAG: hypothetical protein ABL959_17815 [Pyrinomonadaceae bacterium]
MKSLIKIGLGLLALMVVVSLGFLLATMDTRPAIVCSSLDRGTRTRDYCLMNPFRDRGPELAAEKVLVELRDGNVNVLLPFLSDEGKQRILESEAKYRIKTWHIGRREDTGGGVSITYWVTRENYSNESTGVDYIESVNFSLVKSPSTWEVEQFGAIY